MKISVIIPVYEMSGQGTLFLERTLAMLAKQTFKDFEVVISDNSENDEIKNIALKNWGINIIYDKNKRIKNMPGNTNNGILKSKGEYIKILFLDDCLANEDSLKELSAFNGDWLVTACSNNPNPFYSKEIKQGQNTIGSPSVLMFKNKDPLLFNENLTWVVDCEYYIRLFKRYGKPAVLYEINVIIGEGPHQMTHQLSDQLKANEIQWLKSC